MMDTHPNACSRSSGAHGTLAVHMQGSQEAVPQIGFTGTRHGMTPSQRLAVTAVVHEVAHDSGFVAHHGDCVGADAEFHDLCRVEPLSTIVVHPGPLEDLPNQSGRIGDSRRENTP